MSREIHLITRDRPRTGPFLDTLREAVAGTQVEVDGDFENPDAYLNISGPDLWIEIEAPGQVEAADLDGQYGDAKLPEPDDVQCLWLTVANIPLGAPDASADVASRILNELADHCDGTVVKP